MATPMKGSERQWRTNRALQGRGRRQQCLLVNVSTSVCCTVVPIAQSPFDLQNCLFRHLLHCGPLCWLRPLISTHVGAILQTHFRCRYVQSCGGSVSPFRHSYPLPPPPSIKREGGGPLISLTVRLGKCLPLLPPQAVYSIHFIHISFSFY